jgi:hypothetical protein
MSRIKIIEQEKFVACLPGYENVHIGDSIKKIKPRFYHKSGTELRLELEQRIKQLSWNGEDNQVK